MHGRLRTLLALRAAFSSFAFALFDAASFGRFFVWLTSEVSVVVALTVFVAFFATAWPPSAVSAARSRPR